MLMALALPALLGAADRSQARLLQHGLDWMETRGDCVAAIPLFQQAALGPNRNVAARALLYRGLCQEKLGKPEAKASYEAVVRDYADQKEAARDARAFLAVVDQPKSTAAKLARHQLEIREIGGIAMPGNPTRAVLTPDGSELYVTLRDSVAVVDARKRAVTAVLPLGAESTAIAALTDGSRVIVGLLTRGLAIITTREKTITWIETLGPVRDLAITSDGREAFLAMDSHGLRKLNLATRNLQTFASLPGATGVALTRDDRLLYVSCRPPALGGSAGHNALAWYDARSGALVDSVNTLPYIAGDLVVSPDGRQLWAEGQDACVSTPYDHRGCPFVPGPVIHAFTATGKLIRTFGYNHQPPGALSFFPDGSVAGLA